VIEDKDPLFTVLSISVAYAVDCADVRKFMNSSINKFLASSCSNLDSDSMISLTRMPDEEIGGEAISPLNSREPAANRYYSDSIGT
jgi:hypothetical protein